MEGALLSLAIAALAFVAGIRMGRKAAGLAFWLGAALVVTCGLATRYLLAQPEHEFQTVMWIGFLGGVCLMSTLVLIGPAVFDRWLYALALSVGVVAAFRLLVSVETLVCLLTGSCLPVRP